jgi:hypothetical protein
MASKRAPKKARTRKTISAAPPVVDTLKTAASARVNPQLRPLFDALQCAHDAGDALYRCYDELQRAYVEANAPATWEYEGLPLSQREALEHMNDPEKAGKLTMHAEWSFPTGFDLPDAVQELRRAREVWRAAILSARRALDSEAVVVLMDGETALPASERWTTKVARELEEMRNAMPPSPFRRGVGYGEEGMAVLHAMRQLEQRCADLSRVSAAAVSKSPAASPDALSPRWEEALRVLEAAGANLHGIGPDAAADRAEEKLARALPGLIEPQHGGFDGMGTRHDARPPIASGEAGVEPALRRNQALVLRTMARWDTARLVTIAEIRDRMVRERRSSFGDEMIRMHVRSLIDWGLAERPNGRNGGIRLTTRGRLKADRIGKLKSDDSEDE